MLELFDNSRRKLAWAEKRFAQLEKEIFAFRDSEPYKRITEPDLDKPGYTVDKIVLTNGIPESVTHLAGEIIQNLRSSLEIAVYDLAVATGKSDPKFTAFPFAGSVGQMANALGRSKDVPAQIHSLFCGLQPYPGGDDLLWALNELSVADKHKILCPVGNGAFRNRAILHGFGDLISFPDPHVWDSAKNQMVVITFGPEAKLEYQFDFSLFIAFGDIRVVKGKEVLGTLHALGCKVHSILVAIEAEAHRLKLVK